MLFIVPPYLHILSTNLLFKDRTASFSLIYALAVYTTYKPLTLSNPLTINEVLT